MADERKTPKPKVVLDDKAEKVAGARSEEEVIEPEVMDDEPKDGESAAPQAEQDAASEFSFSLFAWVHQAFPGHEKAFWGGVCGLAIALVFFAIGFLRTLLIVVLVLVGVACGQVLDGDPKLINVIKRLFSDRNQ